MPASPRAEAEEVGRRIPAAAAARFTSWFVLPYLLLGLVWAFSNPAGAVPDEGDHLIKALGVARLDIGSPDTTPLTPDADPIQIRNHSISRLVDTPKAKDPRPLRCFGLDTTVTAACQRPAHPETGTTLLPTSVGAYPPFAYLPIGWGAAAGIDATESIRGGRIVVLAMSGILLWLACFHLVTWNGRPALIGIALAVSPMAIFLIGALNTSALEIFGALCVASVVTVYAWHPESLRPGPTKVVMVSGAMSLALSRQLGVVTLALLALLLILLGGWREIFGELRERRPSMIISAVAIAAVSIAVAMWEVRFDHPALIGPWLSLESLASFWHFVPDILQQMVGWFGWLEVAPPVWLNNIWAYSWLVMLTLLLVTGRTRERVLVIGWVCLSFGVAYLTYSRIFFPINAGLQGRHMLPLLSVLPVYAGVAVTRRQNMVWKVPFAAAALALPAVIVFGVWFNGKRYAVGTGPHTGPRWFPPVAQWTPPLGWSMWLILTVVAGIWLAVTWLSLLRTGSPVSEKPFPQ